MAKKLSKRVENTVGKGEIARYEQFLLSHSVFKRLYFRHVKNKDLFRKGLTLFQHYFRYIAASNAPINTFLEFFFTCNPNSILSKLPAAFPHNHCQNN